MKNKIKIYLADLVHNYIGAGSYSFPLNISFISSYAKKFYNELLDIRLFKYPENLIEALKIEVPDILGFSCYTWNEDINKRISAYARKIKADLIIVCGGPNIDCNELGYKEFFEINPEADFYIPYQGEPGFINFLNLIFYRWNITKDKNFDNLDGIVKFDRITKKIKIGKILPRLKNPDEVPSPYLTGELDSFFETKLIPIIETNRGCPFRCSFCAQGFTSFHKIDFFDIERVKDEIEYIAKKIKNTSLLLFADSNFGIHKRDYEIAEFIVRM
ncbi:MAG TPA: hypothetical protein PLD27_13120 [bacterium]|nr:hypothetical protein [bacterium]HPQ19737.1 hypothetical protein [bacterium]